LLHAFLTAALDGGVWSALRPGRFALRERASGPQWIGRWVSPRAGLDTVVKIKIPSSCRDSNTRLSSPAQPVSPALYRLSYAGSLLIKLVLKVNKSRDSSVGIAIGYAMNDRGSRVRFPAEAGNFSHHRVQNGSGIHPASYPIGTRYSFPGGKAAEA
jgi:hypothetical protein